MGGDVLFIRHSKGLALCSKKKKRVLCLFCMAKDNSTCLIYLGDSIFVWFSSQLGNAERAKNERQNKEN